MKFRTYDEGTDTQLFVTTNEGKSVFEQHEFKFTGFGNGIHPYYRKRINRIVEVLKSKGIILNVAEVSTVEKMATDIDSGELSFETLTLPKQDYVKSEDGNTYILFQDTEMGNGWACLIKNNEILEQEHRGTILNELEKGDFIRSFGIDYATEHVESLEAIKSELSKVQA